MIANCGFGRWRKNHFRQLLRFLHTFRQLNAADRTGFLIIFPTAACQITTHNGLHFHRSEFFSHDGAFLQSFSFVFRQNIVNRLTGKMVRHDMSQFFKPKIGNLSQNLPFTRNRIIQNHIECRQTVGSNHQHTFIVNFVQIADFAGVDFFQADFRHFGYLLGRQKNAVF